MQVNVGGGGGCKTCWGVHEYFLFLSFTAIQNELN